MAENEDKTLTADETLLTEIRDRYDYAMREWQAIRDASARDNKLASGDAWDEADKLARKGRPCLNFDEVNQHLNQLGNGFRQNKRAIKVSPLGEGGKDDTSEIKEAIVRRIETRSGATMARSTAFDAEIRGGYGFTKISTRYIDNHSDDQEIVIEAVRNPDSILIDPDYKMPDASDIEYAFECEKISRTEFKRRYPKAVVQDFQPEHIDLAPRWSQPTNVLIATYWRVERTFKKLEGSKHGREVEERRIVQYLTNGLEILDRRPWGGEVKKKDGSVEWHGTIIPIVAWLGKEVFLDAGTGMRRHLYSLIRLCHDPQKLLNFYRSNEAEEAQLTPKTPFIGYKGQFESDKLAWDSITQTPRPYIQIDAVTDPTGQQILPPPTRQPFTPNFQAYEIAAESSRRSVQSAMGISPLPTAAQRRNEKSGIALERMQVAAQQGSYHFNDNADRAIALEGRIIVDLMPVIYDTPRELGIANPDGTFDSEKVNQPVTGEDGQVSEIMLSEGTHDVAVATGPSFESQYDEASEFVDTFISNITKFPIPPEMMTQLLALAVRFKKNLGHIGDEIAEVLAPKEKEQMPPEAMAAIQKMQQELQALDAFGKQQQERADQLQAEKVAKLMDIESKENIARMNNETELAKQAMVTHGDAMLTRMQAQFDIMQNGLEQRITELLQPTPNAMPADSGMGLEAGQ